MILSIVMKVKGNYFGSGAVGTNLMTTVPDSIIFLITSQSGNAGTKVHPRMRFQIQGPISDTAYYNTLLKKTKQKICKVSSSLRYFPLYRPLFYLNL